MLHLNGVRVFLRLHDKFVLDRCFILHGVFLAVVEQKPFSRIGRNGERSREVACEIVFWCGGAVDRQIVCITDGAICANATIRI